MSLFEFEIRDRFFFFKFFYFVVGVRGGKLRDEF